jgi:hypothetical protein
MTTIPNFDHVAVGDKIVALEAEVQNEFAAAKQAAKDERSTAKKTADSEYVAATKAAEAKYKSRSKDIAELLWSMKQHYPDQLNAVCKRSGIGRSRKFELLRIGKGDKTVEQSRKETAARQKKFKGKKKAESVTTTPKVTDSKASAGTGNGSNPDEAAAKMKAAHAADEGEGAADTKPAKKSKSKSAPKSKPAATSCDPEAPKMSDGTEEIESPMQDFDRLAKFKRRIVDREAVWVCEQLELAWSDLRDRGRPFRPRT